MSTKITIVLNSAEDMKRVEQKAIEEKLSYEKGSDTSLVLQDKQDAEIIRGWCPSQGIQFTAK